MTVVFKLGGSLLTLPGLAARVQAAIEHRTSENCLILPGGGATADLVREWTQIHQLDEEAAHWMAIASLDFNIRLLQKLLNWNTVGSREQSAGLWSNDGAPQLLQTEKFITAEEAEIGRARHLLPAERGEDCHGVDRLPTEFDCLPHDWDTTSDSIAAWTAIRWPAHELVLLKSIPAPRGLSAKQASDRNMVDSTFPSLTNQIHRISWCNLRRLPVVIEPWLPSAPDYLS